MKNVLTVFLFLALPIFNAQAGQSCSGSLQIAGQQPKQIGCAAYDDTAMQIPLAQCRFKSQPAVTASGSSSASSDSVAVKVDGSTPFAAQIHVSTYGAKDHNVCANVFVNWEASADSN